MVNCFKTGINRSSARKTLISKSWCGIFTFTLLNFPEGTLFNRVNPLRAGIVQDLSELEKYPYCGHGVLSGKVKSEWQAADYVLRYFSDRKKEARKLYLAYVEAGVPLGSRPDLVGGGLIRSLGGWSNVKSIRKKGMDRIKGDERILGDSDFVLSVLKAGNEKLERKSQLNVMGIDQDYIARRAAKLFGIAPEEIFTKSRRKQRVNARSVFCFWAVQELGLLQTHIAQKLKMTPAGVGYAVMRGEKIIKEHGVGLLEDTI